MEKNSTLIAALITIFGNLGLTAILAKREAVALARIEKLKTEVLWWRILSSTLAIVAGVGWYI